MKNIKHLNSNFSYDKKDSRYLLVTNLEVDGIILKHTFDFCEKRLFEEYKEKEANTSGIYRPIDFISTFISSNVKELGSILSFDTKCLATYISLPILGTLGEIEKKYYQSYQHEKTNTCQIIKNIDCNK